MDQHVEMTEWVRFNDNGSSDHIKVIDGELFDSFHMDPSPYLNLRDWPPVPAGEVCDWLIETKKLPK
ncbi:MAG: hypothetical protein ACR2PS_05635 [Pseudomonadales bacterium]